MGQLKDLTGQRFGRWAILRRAGTSSNKKVLWECRCDCGTTKAVVGGNLLNGKSISCGCVWRETMAEVHTSHGHAYAPEYRSWQNMKSRCFNSKNPKYKDYGARGITVCDEWRGDFAAFLAHIGHKPSPTHTVDRINNDGNYEPGNVRWATPTEQRNNQRREPPCRYSRQP